MYSTPHTYTEYDLTNKIFLKDASIWRYMDKFLSSIFSSKLVKDNSLCLNRLNIELITLRKVGKNFSSSNNISNILLKFVCVT